MLPLRDANLRLILFNHIAARLYAGDPAELRAAGIDSEQLRHLRALSTADWHRLAAMREPMIALRIDSQRLQASLRSLSLMNETRSLEDYFIRHGASWRMMRRFFKLGHKMTLRRRRECGSYRPAGRLPLPKRATRESIWQVWLAIAEREPRARFYRLHQRFHKISLEVLAIVVAQFEKEP